ncbi:xylose isomerase [Candidatus Margulisiibacteriota bacterium]
MEKKIMAGLELSGKEYAEAKIKNLGGNPVGVHNYVDKEYFPGVKNIIQFEGPNTKNELAFKYFDPNRKLSDGKTMGELLRFSIAFWHHLRGDSKDMFGPGSRVVPWGQEANAYAAARSRMHAMLEFAHKTGVGYYCFHDFDLIDEGVTYLESTKRLQYAVEYLKALQKEYGVNCLWGTQNCFSNPRYRRGAATSPNFDVVAYAGAQIKNAIDATIALGGKGHVFWGGREGYAYFNNTNMELELNNLAIMLTMAVDYARKQGFKGSFFIEPKPKEPMTHQYDFDASTAIGFLNRHGLQGDFKMNIEANHATLAGHTFAHELEISRINNMLGSIDLNTGDPLLGWDTDHFNLNSRSLINPMLVLLKNGGLAGGLNFDAKLRRESTGDLDLFYAFIGGIDAAAKALLIADQLRTDDVFKKLTMGGYSSMNEKVAQVYRSGELSLEDLAVMAESSSEPKVESGQEERTEKYIDGVVANFRG